MSARTTIRALFDDRTWTVTCVIIDNATRRAAIVPVLDFAFGSGRAAAVQAQDHGNRKS